MRRIAKIISAVFMMILLGTSVAGAETTASYQEPVEIKADRTQPHWIDQLVINQPYHVVMDYTNTGKWGMQGGWDVLTLEMHHFTDGSNEDLISDRINVHPDTVISWAGQGNSPDNYALLGINGVPWQAFQSMEYSTEVENIKYNMENYSAANPVLPEGAPFGKKMISIYQGSTIVARYTASTVDARHLLARTFTTEDGRMMVPLRGVVDYLGADISYDSDSGYIVIKRGGTEVRLKNGSKDARVNGMPQLMDVAPVAKDGYTMVPLSFLSDQLGFTVKWYGSDTENPVLRADVYN